MSTQTDQPLTDQTLLQRLSRRLAKGDAASELDLHQGAASRFHTSKLPHCISSPRLSYGRHRGPARRRSRQAAVVIAIYPDRQSDEYCVTLTRRPQSLSHHGGQVCLPGGKVESGESVFQAALREYQEELGIPIRSPRLIGYLSPVYVFGSDNWVNTIVVSGEKPLDPPDPDPVEVDEVIEVRLQSFWHLGHLFRDFELSRRVGVAESPARDLTDEINAGSTIGGSTLAGGESTERQFQERGVALLRRQRKRPGKTAEGEPLSGFRFGASSILFSTVDGRRVELWGATAMLLEEFASILTSDSGEG